MARVTLTDDAADDLRDLDRSQQVQALRGLKKLEDAPEQRGLPLGSKASGHLTHFRQLVVGNRDPRVVYQVPESGDVVVVWVIGRRADYGVSNLSVARLEPHPDPAVRGLETVIRPLMPEDQRGRDG